MFGLTKRVVLAADSVRIAMHTHQPKLPAATPHPKHVPGTACADADDSDGVASEADEDIDVLHDNSYGRKNARSRRVAGLFDCVAALDGSSTAAARARAPAGGRGGGRKDCQGGDGEELGEHGVRVWLW